MARIVSGPQITGQVRNKQTGSSIGPVTVTVNQTVYTDAEFTTGTTTLTTDGMGRFSCYAEPGTYTFTSSEPLVGPIESVEVLSPDMGAHSGSGRFLTSTEASAAYASLSTALNNHRMAVLARDERALSAASHRVDYEDSTVFTEDWADLTAWALGAAGALAVSGNKLFNNNSGAATAGANKALSVPVTTGRARVVAKITLVNQAAGNSGLTAIGLSVDATGVGPASASPNSFLIGVRQTGRAIAYVGGNLGGGGTVDLGALPDGTYVASVTADEFSLSGVIRSTDGATEFRYRINRTVTLNNAAAFNNDGRMGSGGYISSLGARASSATITPRSRTAAIEGGGDTGIWTLSTSGGDAIRVALPATYDSRKPAPVCIVFHQSVTGNERTPQDDVIGGFTTLRMQTVAQPLLNAGYIVASHNMHGDSWGNAQSLADTLALYQYVRDHYAMGPVVFLAASMGGLSALNVLARNAIPGVAGYAGIGAVSSLADLYANPTYTAAIKTAYGIAGDGSDYASKTAGYDTALRSGWEFRGVPMRLYSSAGDTTVPKATNCDALTAAAAPYTTEATVVLGSGGHLDISQYQGSDVVSFFNRCIRA